MFKKKENSTKMSKLKNTIALKRNLYAVILSIIFIAVTIGIIALSTVLAQKYPLDLDLTTNKQHSISEDNFEYISSIDKTINIYVLATEEQYNCDTGSSADIVYIGATKHYIGRFTDNVVYYEQTVELLNKYHGYNENINVQFVDTYDAQTRELISGFSDFDWDVGDILVEGKFTVDGKEVVRRTVVPFEDTYTLEDTYQSVEQYKAYGYESLLGYAIVNGQAAGYMITENKIETMISSAIYKVTSPNTPVFLVPTAISNDKSVSDALEQVLEVNNFEIEYSDKLLSVLLTEENYDKYTGIILSDCKADISVTDREVIEKFLNNKGEKGKSLYYFAGTNTMNLKNLRGFLGDWGIEFESGLLYETSTGYHMSGQPTFLAMETVETDYTKSTDESGLACIGDNLVVMKEGWISQNSTSTTATYTRTTEVLMRTVSKGTVVMPMDADIKTWKPADDAEKDIFATAIFSRDDDTKDSKYISSYVVAFASPDLISAEHNENNIGNMDLVLSTFNAVVGNSESEFSFVPKTIKIEYYDTTEGSVIATRIIFLGVVPVVIITLGIVVWIRRKRR